MVSQLRAAILSLNPTMYWPLDELVGLTAFDLSGNGNNGTYNSNIQQGVTGVPGDVPGSTGIEFFPQPGAAPFKGVSRSGLAAPPGLSVVFYFRIFVNTFGASEVPFSWTGGSANGFLCQFNSASQNLQLLVGTAGGYPMDGEPQVSYGIDRAWWGRGLASRALALLLERGHQRS